MFGHKHTCMAFRSKMYSKKLPLLVPIWTHGVLGHGVGTRIQYPQFRQLSASTFLWTGWFPIMGVQWRTDTKPMVPTPKHHLTRMEVAAYLRSTHPSGKFTQE